MVYKFVYSKFMIDWFRN